MPRVIALTIDEKGMADSADRKLAVARRIRDLAVNEFGLDESDLVFDPLTFTLASGSSETAKPLWKRSRQLSESKKKMPDAFTCLGVSNISYGLNPAARPSAEQRFSLSRRKGRIGYGHHPSCADPALCRTIRKRTGTRRKPYLQQRQRPFGKFIRSFPKNEARSVRQKTTQTIFNALDLDQRIYQRIIHERTRRSGR